MRPAVPAKTTARRSERGFALLIVFLLAAAVALMLYQQIPRVAFESQRDKEELLIEHGQQYTRAIQLYFVAFKKYPSKIEDLENTNDKRFLRRRFIDPMTGKDEWRLIHVNAAGVLTDSLVQKPPTVGQPGTTAAGASGATGAGTTNGTPNSGTNGATASSTNNGTNNGVNPNSGFTGLSSGSATNSATNNGNDPNQPPQVNATVYRRPSDRPLVNPNGMAQNTDTDPNDPRYWPPITLVQPGAQTGTQPGAQPSGSVPSGLVPGQPGVPQGFQPPQGFQAGIQPGAQASGFPVGAPSGLQPGVPGLPGNPNAGANPQGFVPQFPGQQFPGQQYPGQANPALQNPSANFTQPGAATQDPNAPNPQYPNPAPNPPSYAPQSFQGQFNPQQTVAQGQTGAQGAAGTPGGPGNPAGNAALSAINTLLTTPRQTPAPIPDAGGSMNTGGLAGVASTYSAPSIKVYKDRHKYNEWEFIFDMKSGLPGQQPAATPTPGQNGQGQGGLGQGTPGQGAPGQGTPGQGAGSQNPGQSNSTFGPSNTFAPSTTFGSPSGSPGGSGASPPPQ
jgi:hypothetical protein